MKYFFNWYLHLTTVSTQSTIQKSRSLKLSLIALPLILIAFLIILTVQQQRISALQETQTNLTAHITALSEERNFYRTQYETTVEDVNTLARIHGETSRYAQLAQELRAQELQDLIKSTSNKTHYIKNGHLWLEYAANGIISLACLNSPQTIDTISDITLLEINTTRSNYTIYIDGTYVADMTWHDALSVELKKGMHEIGIASNGPITVDSLTFDAIPLDVTKATIDHGAAWEVFDCDDAIQGNRIERPATMRILFEKK